MTKLTITAVGLALLLSACGDDVKVNMTESAPKVIAVKDLKIPLTEEQICSDVTIEKGDGVRLRGTRRCDAAKKVCAKIGDTECRMEDKTKYGIHDPKLKPKNIRKGIKIGAKEGEATISYPVCTTDGQTGCITTATVVSVDTTTIAAKTPQGSTVGGVAGTYDPGYPDPKNVLDTDTVNGQPGQIATCSAAGQTNCVASAAFKPVPKTELDPTAIRQGATIGGVAGSYQGAFSQCTADGANNCITTNALVAMRPGDLDATKIRENIKLAGVTGTLKPSPAACDGSVKVGCVTTANFPAADYNLITQGNIKKSVTIAKVSGSVTGDYPSTSHPLSGGSNSITDLTAANFNTRIASSDDFEYWTAAGAQQSGNGDADLDKDNIVNTATIFSVTGAVTAKPDDCSDTVSVSCTTTASHVSYNKSLMVAENVKNGEAIATETGTVNGVYPSASHTLPGASGTADLTQTTFNTQVKDDATFFEYWDATGTRHSAKGSAALAAGNLLTGAQVFGVTGTSDLRPVDCSNSKHTACVTTSNHPAYDPANLQAKNVKNGEKIGLVTGTYPSAGNPLASASATIDDLKGSTFNSQLALNKTFEYWDHIGNRYTGSGSTVLAATNIATGVKVFGVTGTQAIAPAACTSAGQTGCLAVTAFPSYNPGALVPSVVKNGHTIGTVTGTYPSVGNPLGSDNGAIANLGDQTDLYTKLPSSAKFEFWDSAGNHHEVSGDTNLHEDNILKDVDIFGVKGKMVAAPAPCTAEGQAGCAATATLRPFNTTTLTAGVLKKGVSLGGVTGDYPSTNYPLPNASVTRDLFATGSSFATEVTTPGAVEFWDSVGNYHTKVREGLDVANIRQSTVIFGKTGTAIPAPGACDDTTVLGCLTSATYPAYKDSEIQPVDIKAGVKIGNATGIHPSASSPLAGNGSTENLTLTTFADKITKTAQFEYWDADGTKHVGSGSALLTEDNILAGQTVFGVLGKMESGGQAININMANVRAGVKVGTSSGIRTGSRKVSCANTATSGSSGFETTDDHNNGGSLPPREPFGSTKSCRQNSFTEMHYEGNACNGAFECRYRDKITGMVWNSSRTNGGSTHRKWVEAKKLCTDRGMRLPTQKELFTVYVNGITQGTRVNSLSWTQTDRLWLGTAPSRFDDERYYVYLFNFDLQRAHTGVSSNLRAYCISD